MIRLWNMRTSVAILLLVLAVCAAISACLLSPSETAVDEPRVKRFNRVIAEDVRIRQHGIYGIDLITCRTCRLEKRKLGMMTLGGLNTLVLEDLNIVLPPCDRREEDSSEGAGDGRATAREIVNRLGLSDRIVQMGGARLRFSGLKIKNLSLAMLSAETNICPSFVASWGEAQKDGLHLMGCKLTKDGRTNDIGRAVLKFKPDLCLIWPSGALHLDRCKSL